MTLPRACTAASLTSGDSQRRRGTTSLKRAPGEAAVLVVVVEEDEDDVTEEKDEKLEPSTPLARLPPATPTIPDMIPAPGDLLSTLSTRLSGLGLQHESGNMSVS